MAVLNASQATRRLEREKKRQDALVKKREAQQKKELLGENWKQIEQNKIVNDLEIEIGSDNAPKIYDFVDVYDFFDPIIMYKSAEGKPLQLDFENFKKSEDDFKDQIAVANQVLSKLNQEDNLGDEVIKQDIDEDSQDSTDIQDNNELPNIADDLNEDGEDRALLDNPPSKEDHHKFMLNAMSGIDETNEDDINPNKDGEEYKEKVRLRLSGLQLAKAKFNSIASTYLDRFVPMYSRSVCSCCGVPKRTSEYFITYSLTNNSKVDSAGNRRMPICKTCSLKLFAYYYKITNKDLEKTMRTLCSHLNIYWDADILNIARSRFNDSGRTGSLLSCYIMEVSKQFPGKTFIDSPDLGEVIYRDDNKNKDVGYDWSKQDFQNREQVISIIGYDPFEYEENDEDKKILYADFLAIVDDDISNDYIKCMSAVSIVKSFFTVRKLDQRQHQLEKEDAPLNDQKAVSDLKAKELKNITDFAAANGFSERFKTKQSKGENTFTGIVARIDKAKFEKGIANRFDVLTSESIQQASDASFKSIFSQLNMGESELFKVTADQLRELRQLRSDNQKLQEEIRQVKYKLAEANMKEKLRAENDKGGDSEWV